jgi:hypothetical protein
MASPVGPRFGFFMAQKRPLDLSQPRGLVVAQTAISAAGAAPGASQEEGPIVRTVTVHSPRPPRQLTPLKLGFAPVLDPLAGLTDVERMRFSAGFTDQTEHSELARAKGRGRDDVTEVPGKPLKMGRPSKLDDGSVIPGFKNLELMRKLVEESVATQQGFGLKFSPGVCKSIERIRPLNIEGEEGKHHDVYLCDVAGGEKWVLKVLKPIFLNEKANEVAGILACQLSCYAKNMKHPVMSKYTAPHLNFDAHLQAIEGLNSLNKVKEYVKKNLKHGFMFVKYIPEAFPFERTPETREIWDQLKEIYSARTVNDCRRNNIRVLDEKIYLIDLLEYDEDWVDYNELARSFTNDANLKHWLLT